MSVSRQLSGVSIMVADDGVLLVMWEIHFGLAMTNNNEINHFKLDEPHFRRKKSLSASFEAFIHLLSCHKLHFIFYFASMAALTEARGCRA